jgi:hypothetical protein
MQRGPLRRNDERQRLLSRSRGDARAEPAERRPPALGVVEIALGADDDCDIERLLSEGGCKGI